MPHEDPDPTDPMALHGVAVATDDPTAAEAMTVQTALFKARRSSLQGQLEIVDQQIASLRQEIAGRQSQQQPGGEPTGARASRRSGC